MVYTPEQHFTKAREAIYSEMHWSNWWWETQVRHAIKCTRIQSNVTYLILIMPLYQDVLPEGATLVPILLGVDETRLSRLGRVVAHPLYVTIGNLPK